MKKILLFLCCAGTFSADAQQNNNWLQQKIDSLVGVKAIPGIIAGTSSKGIRTYYTSGFADTSSRQLLDSATQLEIGSISKTFTAYILTAILQQKGISDSSFIGSYLPDSVQANVPVAKIRFIELMNHTSGLPRLPDNMDATSFNSIQPYALYGAENLYSYLQKVVPDTSHKMTYSNLGAGLAGVLAERISGRSYSQLLKQYITRPFNMKYTGTTIAKNRKLSTGYLNGTIAEYWNMNILQPAGGIKSDAGDLLTYLEYFLQHQQLQLIQSLTTPTAQLNKQIKVARGWHLLNRADQPFLVWHNGGTYGFSTFCAFHKESGNAVFVAINAFNKNQIADGLGIEIITKMLAVQ